MIFISHFFSIVFSVAILIVSTSSLFPARPAGISDVATKLHVLEELGIEFSEETRGYIKESVNNSKALWADSGIDASQFSSYPSILLILGTRDYDMVTDSFIPLTDSLYAFDAECFDIIESYGDFLLAVSRISGGEIHVGNYHSDVDESIFESGIGTQEVTFDLNGHPYCFTAQFYYDWMDCGIIDFVNDILDEQEIDKRIWCMYDGGQGFVVFYNTAEWAREFYERTGCPLAVKANEAF